MKRKTHAALALATLLCACGPSEPCPRDEALIDRFVTDEASFEKLLKNPDDAELRSRLKIRNVYRNAGPILFTTWEHDFVGPGGVLKGYTFIEEEPGTLVESIDDNSEPGSAEDKRLYRRIKPEGHWYLFYSSNN